MMEISSVSLLQLDSVLQYLARRCMLLYAFEHRQLEQFYASCLTQFGSLELSYTRRVKKGGKAPPFWIAS